MKQKQTNKSKECPLTNPNIDIIPENNHLVGICLCQFCTCGKHICPKNRHLSSHYLHDSFDTSYSRSFRKTVTEAPYKPRAIKYKPNRQKMDFATTNSINYQPRAPIVKQVPLGSSYSPAKTTLLSTTAYSYYYPDWGKQKINYEKVWHAPVRSVDIPFRGETSYSREYSKIDLNKVTNFDPKKFAACQSHISISPKAAFNPHTTYSEKMQDYSHTRLNTHVKVKSPMAVATPATATHYQTSTERFFKPTSASYLDPRKVRLSLLSRGSIS